MAANEMFITTALIDRSVYSHAKSLNYLPSSVVAPTATVNVQINAPTTGQAYTESYFTVPKYHQFISEAIDGVNYTFITTDEHTAYRQNITFPFYFNGMMLKQGDPVTIVYDVNLLNNPSCRFTIPSANVDVSTLSVSLRPVGQPSTIIPYERSTDVTTVDANSRVYFIERSADTNYTVYFGDDVVGRKPNTGDSILLNYIVTLGEYANKANVFTMVGLNNVESAIVTAVAPASGGSPEETVESIKRNAPIYYSSQNRAVTKNDFDIILRKDFPNIESTSVWGGEENDPPIYGKIFVALNPKQGYILTEAEKEEIRNKLIDERVTVTLNPEIVDPIYTYIKLKVNVEYNKTLTVLSKEQIVSAMRNNVIDYNERELGRFGAFFALSKLATIIDETEPSVLGNDTRVFLEKRFEPIIGEQYTYSLKFNNRLKRGNVLENLKSTAFNVVDEVGIVREVFLEEEPLSYTGIDSIIVTSPGYGYLTAPKVTITGDGTGATAEAKIVNGKVESIKVTERGSGYTTATVTIGDGTGPAYAKPVVSARYGTIRTIYYNVRHEKVVLNSEAGTIDYDTGQIDLTNFTTTDFNEYISITIEAEDPIIEPVRGNILVIDISDPNAIVIDLKEVR
jgi:hypothetical protein